MTPARAWLIWSAALSAYVLGVFHRSSLAVAGLDAAERFHISAAQLSTFVVLQLAVYALLQIPVGVLVDRFGPRLVLLVGIAAMTLGQFAFALARSYPMAVGARVCVGTGDATTLVCVLRLANTWFGPRQIPLLSQITGPLGQVGAVAATAPMTWSLAHLGWERSYAWSAATGLLVALGVLALVDDAPGRRRHVGGALSWRQVRHSVQASWGQPRTRLAFWIHFSHHFSATLLGLVWGFPFLVRGEGLDPAHASALLSLMIIAVVVSGPVVGWLIAVLPQARLAVAVGALVAVTATWTAVLCWPGRAPHSLLFALVLVVGAAGPVAMIGFDVVREDTPPQRLATAMGVVNQGGFIASLMAILAVGIILDRVGLSARAVSGVGLESYRTALSFQYVLWGIGLIQMLRHGHAIRNAQGDSRSVGQ